MHFSRLLLLNEREQSMTEHFHYELTPVPTSHFEDGMTSKSSKSVLMKAITRSAPKDACYTSAVPRVFLGIPVNVPRLGL